MIIVQICWDEFAWLRVANIIAAVVAMTALGISFSAKRENIPRRYRRLAVCLYILLAAIAYGSGRAAALGAPVAEHVAFLFVALIILALSVFWHPKGDDSLPGQHDTALLARARRAFRYYWMKWRGNASLQ